MGTSVRCRPSCSLVHHHGWLYLLAHPLRFYEASGGLGLVSDDPSSSVIDVCCLHAVDVLYAALTKCQNALRNLGPYPYSPFDSF